MTAYPRGITDRPALLLVMLANDIMARAEDPLAALGLSGRQYTVLAVLGSDAPPSQLELAGLCGLLPAQIVSVVDELQRRELVARDRSETDRRRSVVTLTTAGREMLEQADQLCHSVLEWIDDESREVVVDALSRSYKTPG
jgi:DNA-binding MarR family transcriptional regulator